MNQLDTIIEPEIHNDELAAWLTKLAGETGVNTILEVGSSDGRGSTAALIKGMVPHHCELFCIETSKARFESLRERYKGNPGVYPIWAVSGSESGFMSEQQISDFYNSTPTNLNQYPLAQVLGWLKQDLDYITKENVPIGGIEMARREAGVRVFDLAVLDGSAFTGMSDLELSAGSRYFVLDDIQDIKHFESYKLLSRAANYSLLAENKTLRNGYAIFKRK